VLHTFRLFKERSENINVAHGKAQPREADPTISSDGPCLSSNRCMTEIRDGDALTYCDVLVSEGDSPAMARITGTHNNRTSFEGNAHLIALLR
jgi:hypothetical protein